VLRLEHRADLVRDGVGVVVELAPGDADHPPAGGLEAPVAGAVFLERLAGAVAGVAVELDDEVVVGPRAVGFDGVAVEVDGRVDAGAWELGFVEDLEEAGFEVAAGEGVADRFRFEEFRIVRTPRCPGCRATRAPRERGSVSRRYSASLMARSRWLLGRTAARSRSVRGGVVVGMPLCSVTSSSGRRARCGRKPGRGRNV
jgi:hypothetical protein